MPRTAAKHHSEGSLGRGGRPSTRKDDLSRVRSAVVRPEDEVVADLVEALRAHVGELERLFDLLDKVLAAIEPQEGSPGS